MNWKQIGAVMVAIAGISANGLAQKPPLLPASQVTALDQELSGDLAKRNLEALAVFHRTRGSRPLHDAGQMVVDHARAYGMSDAHIETFPADGKASYGTLLSRPAWDAEFAELWEVRQQNGQWVPAERLACWDTQPITLAEDSESADVTTDLVDVGTGTLESDYTGKDVRGKIVLASEQPSAVAGLAVTRFGAAGIISYVGNAPGGAWSGQSAEFIRWGHFYTFTLAPPVKSFGFMISAKTAAALQSRLARGEQIRLHAVVRAGAHPGNYDVVTMTIPGADSQLRTQEIGFSCHLDHHRPGANDDLSGCVVILETARTLQKLISEGKLPRPARTLRFLFGPEGEGSIAFLVSHPETAAGMRAVVHLDMVGGIPSVTGSVFHVTRAPASLPSVASDVAEAFADFLNEQSELYADTGRAPYPFVSAEGSKNALQAEFADHTGGSDHQIYDDSSFAIPAIYMNDSPDRYIHTQFDSPANIDPTKLKRAAFISAASGYFLAQLSERDIPATLALIEQRRASRLKQLFRYRAEASPEEAANQTRFAISYERAMIESINRFAPLQGENRAAAEKSVAAFASYVGNPPPGPAASGDAARVYRRNPDLKGPAQFGPIDYFNNHVAPELRASLKISRLQSQGRLRGGGGAYTYEILNFTDGRRTVQEIRDAVSAEYGPVPAADVLAYLEACQSAGLVQRVR
jgi:hypothetical protein